MSHVRADTSPMETAYARKASEDREENHRQQETIKQQIADLASELEKLRKDDQFLTRLLTTLTGKAEHTDVQQGQDANTPDPVPSPVPAARTAPAEQQAHTAAHEAKPKPPSGKDGQLPMSQLALNFLASQGEPRTAKEIRLGVAPQRDVPGPTVYAALSQLVSKGLVSRHKQKNRVLYSASKPEVD